jgi:sugar phosphate isomerase/epimerase
MKKLFALILPVALLFASCNSGQNGKSAAANSTAVAQESPNEWKFGVALWTFHNVDFPQSLDEVDSAGLKYIEPNTFHSAGPYFKDSTIGQLSPEGIAKIKKMIASKGLICASLYIVGDSTLASWKKQFDIAKELGVRFVTTEPPLNMWNSLDSMAGAYGIKIAIHDHWRGFSHYWNPDTTLLAMKDHPNFFVCADLGHWPKSGIHPLDAVRTLNGHIIAVHFKDIAAYNNTALKDVVAGTGVVKFPEILAELKKQNLPCNIYIERDSIEPGGNLQSVIKEKKYYDSIVSKLQ